MGAARRDDRGGMGGPDVLAPSSQSGRPAAQQPDCIRGISTVTAAFRVKPVRQSVPSFPPAAAKRGGGIGWSAAHG